MRLLIVDDHQIMRQGLKSLLEKESGVESIAEAGSWTEAQCILSRVKTHIAIVDIALHGLNGIEATRRIRSMTPSTKVIVLSMYSEIRFGLEAIKAGASGFLQKDCAFEELRRAIQVVGKGDRYIAPPLIDAFVREFLKGKARQRGPVGDNLTSRQREILRLISEGRSTREISRETNLSVKTVETHRQHVKAKLNINSTPGLVKYSIRQGLIAEE